MKNARIIINVDGKEYIGTPTKGSADEVKESFCDLIGHDLRYLNFPLECGKKLVLPKGKIDQCHFLVEEVDE